MDGRLKLTEQGEVVAARYADARIARRHLEQLTNAALLAPVEPEDADRATDPHGPAGRLMDELAADALASYRALIDDPGFPAWFRRVTPIDEVMTMRLGSRPASRARTDPHDAAWLGQLRAIPWVFAWAQARIELPAWYGLGTALERFQARHGAGALEQVTELYRRWPFLASVIDNAEAGLARVDLAVARRHAAEARDGLDDPRWQAVEAEFERTVRLVLRVKGESRLLEDAPVLRRAIELRNPYVAALSELQLDLLGRLRSGETGHDTERIRRLVQLTINGISAGLQGTG